MKRSLSDQDWLKLEELNQAVDKVIAERRQWLDSKMSEYADLQVGDDIYNLLTGQLLGKVSRLYRYWRDRDEGVRDRTLSIDYEYEVHEKVFDNTSRQTGVFGAKYWDRATFATISTSPHLIRRRGRGALSNQSPLG